MSQYIQFVADRLLLALGCEKAYHAANPFDWCGGRNVWEAHRRRTPLWLSALRLFDTGDVGVPARAHTHNSIAPSTHPAPRPPRMELISLNGKTNFFEKRCAGVCLSVLVCVRGECVSVCAGIRVCGGRGVLSA